jgi:pimeloyl-ACP methyl ester carboxylesterase
MLKLSLAVLLLLCPLALTENIFNRYKEYFDPAVDNDAWKTMGEICSENGYATEEYQVTTKDGYILTMYRIPGYLNETKPYSKKPVVLL